MSRFNTPQGGRPPAGQPGQGQPYFEDPQSWATQPTQRPHRGQAPQPQQPVNSAQGYYGAAPMGQAQGGYPGQTNDAYGYQAGGYPAAHQGEPQAAGYYPAPQQVTPQTGYTYGTSGGTAAADPFAPQGQAGGPNGTFGAPQQTHLQPRQPAWNEPFDVAAGPAQAAHPGYGYAGGGYADGYDAAYQTQVPRTQPGAQAQQWGAHDGYGAEPAFEAPMHPAHGMYGAPPQQAGAFDQSYAEDDYEPEQAPAGRNWSKIAAVIGAFVVLGGSMTYGYNTLMSPSPSGGGTPVVKGDESPFKVKPSDPGGKQFAHSDSKIMDRLGDGGAGGAAASATAPTDAATPASETDASGVRKVPVLVVGRDGTIQAPQPTPPSEPKTRATVVVPGLTVIDGLGGGPVPAPVVTANVPPKTVTASEPQQPVVVTPPQPTKKVQVISSASPAAADAADKKPPVAKKEKVAAAAPQVTAALPAAPQGAPTNGYVVVLASVPASANSRMDALKQFADMQQKYAGVLQDKMPDVREANLGEKGTYHRLLAGPPGSKESANQVCTQLKAQGYAGCWVTAY